MAKAYPSASSKADEEKFQAEMDVRTLVEADDIRKDKPRLKRALACAKEQMAALEKVKA